MGKLGLALVGRALLSKALIQLSADGWDCTLSLVVVWPKATQTWRFMGSMVRLINGEQEGLCHRGTFQCPVSMVSPLHKTPSNTSSWFGSVSCGVTASLLGDLVNEKFCFLPPRLESQFPPVFWKSYNQIPLTLKARFPVPSLSLCQIPRIMWGSEPSQQWRHFGIIVSSLWVTLFCTYRIWFLSWLNPSYHLIAAFPLYVGYLFLVGSSIFLSMVV